MTADEYRARRYSSQDGLSLYFRDYGDLLSPRLPLLCLPGLTRNSADFARIGRRYAGERRILCPDYRGRGRSDYDRNWRNYEPRVYMDDIAQLLAVTGCQRVVVLGTSLGGLLGMALAVLKPTSLAALVLNDIGPELDGAGMDQILRYIAIDRPQSDWAAAANMLRETLPTLSLATEAEWLDFARGTFREGPDRLLHFDWDIRIVRALRAAGPIPDLWPLFRALRRVPALALRGERSNILSAATLARMAEAKPDLACVTVPRSGHAPTLAEPQSLAALDDFLARF